ncbi:MAG: Bax inhibitor-1 family protein, partial [Pirellulales bacterium]
IAKMSYSQNPYQPSGSFYPAAVAESGVDERVEFIRKTYTHLTAAVLGFAFIIAALLQIDAIGGPGGICETMLRTPFSYLFAMFGLMAVSWICEKWACHAASKRTQYAGLIVYAAAEALFFTPMVWLAENYAKGSLVIAVAVTLAVFVGLTLSVFMTKADFSFLRSALMIGTLGAIAVAICMMFTGVTQGWFLILMGVFVILACGYILYNTSNVLHHYPVGMHVAASLALFASLTTLLWYVLHLVMLLSGRD